MEGKLRWDTLIMLKIEEIFLRVILDFCQLESVFFIFIYIFVIAKNDRFQIANLKHQNTCKFDV